MSVVGSLFSKPKKSSVVIPKPKDPPPTPTMVSEDVMRKKVDERRKLMAQVGRQGTILTFGQLGEPNIGRKSLLAG